jgi:hypothetical protein
VDEKLEKFNEIWSKIRNEDSLEQSILKYMETDMYTEKFKYCHQCKNATLVNYKLSKMKDKCYYCGEAYWTYYINYYGEITSIEQAKTKLIMTYNTGSTNMGEFSWGKHFTAYTDGLSLGRIGRHDDKSGNHQITEYNTEPKLPFPKGIIMFKQWWYLWNETKSPQIYIYKLNIPEQEFKEYAPKREVK